MTAQSRRGGRVANIPAGAPFVDALAAGIWDMAGRDDPLALTRVTVLLPTRRAIRSLREAFLRFGGGVPVLLPRLMPLGELDEDGLLLEEGAGAALDVPPAVPGLRRQLLLAQLVRRFGAASLPEAPDEAQSARLAEALARLLDEMQTERADPAKLGSLAPEAFARHWQQTLSFLAILTEHWPKILDAEGALDPAARRNALLAAQADLWRKTPPLGPVIAAGSTGSIPATADLLGVVASLPQGRVVLPGLDRDMSEDRWRALLADRALESHPQFGLARLLARLDVPRDEVAEWSSPVAPRTPPARAGFFARALDPQADDGGPSAALPDPAAALAGVTRLDAPGPLEEAGAIALMMREAVEHEGETAALVTPDRDLARRVAAELRRWDIEVDDSAGQPLAGTPAGAFARLALAMIAEDLAPVATLAALKHPLAAGGEKTVAFRDKARALERIALRGVRPAPGFAGLRRALTDGGADKPLLAWLEGLAAAAAPLCAALESPAVEIEELLRAHVAWLEWLAADDTLAGAARLWRGDDGEALAGFVAELTEAARGAPPMAGRAYPALFETLLTGRVVRPRYGAHPRLFIWGPLEARLQHADLVILGGLNEGVWPADPGADPWMSRPMREAFGLPSPERRIGQAAHDVAQAFAAPRVVLTRAQRIEGTPTVPSRWLQRLDNLLLSRKAAPLAGGEQWLAWQQALDASEGPPTPIQRPAPTPPLAARPRRLSVTEIETWMRDPYGIYARHVLKLRALDPLDADPGAADRGSFIHAALDRFVKDWRPAESAEAGYERLLGYGLDAFAPALDRPGVWAFWWPRFERIARWFAENEIARRREATPLAVEGWGEMTLDGPGGAFTLVAKADRIDSLGRGKLVVVDYKTGQPPNEKELTFGFAPQLPLEAMMAAAGAFKGVPAAEVERIEFWRLSGGRPPGKVTPYDAGLFAEEARRGLINLIAAFDDPATPYLARPRADHAPRFSDYEHLARVKEWASSGEEDGEA